MRGASSTWRPRRTTPDTPVARAEALRLTLLEGVLPAPEKPVPVDELKAFKDEHAQSRAAFRVMIEEELLRVALIDDSSSRQRQKELSEKRLRQEFEEIAAKMQERRWPKIVFGTVFGLAALGAAATATVATGGAGAVLAVPGLIAGAYGAIEGFPRRQIPGSPVAYAALARAKVSN